MFVVPLIVPLMLTLPLDVVTVQSDNCAEGFDSVELTQTISSVIAALDIVVGSDETEDFETTKGDAS